MINCGGEKIYLLELENIFFIYWGVWEVVVILIFSLVYGEEFVVFIVLDGQYYLISEEIFDWFKVKIVCFKLLVCIIFICVLLCIYNGKVSKQQFKMCFVEFIIMLLMEDKK